MADRVVEVADDGRYLARFRGFMTVKTAGAEVGRVPLDDIAVVLVTGRGTVYTNGLLSELAQRGAALVICTPNYLPVAWLWPLKGHHVQGERMAAQLEATRPMGKRLWRRVVQAKIERQAAVLERLDRPWRGVASLVGRVRVGDPDNVEAQAARRYWPLVFGDRFRRSQAGEGVNAMLNYGYTVLRAAAARAVVSAGLHPSLGIHHRNRYDHLRLADDLMEPFRPFVDLTVAALALQGEQAVTTEVKRDLAGVLVRGLPSQEGTTPVGLGLLRLARSLAQSYLSRESSLDLPRVDGSDLAPWWLV